ncbi:MAG: hypothetical protein LAO78_14395 [Acidobacteriia bacterium]|nr:hypothetical protein [Terriglobia bacterium]
MFPNSSFRQQLPQNLKRVVRFLAQYNPTPAFSAREDIRGNRKNELNQDKTNPKRPQQHRSKGTSIHPAYFFNSPR